MTAAPKKRKAWLITWDSSRENYFRDLNRPRVVAILKPHLGSAVIKSLLAILFSSESHLTFTNKLGHTFARGPRRELREDLRNICYGDDPWLRARLVKDLYVVTYPDAIYRQTLHWTEYPLPRIDPETFDLVEVSSDRPMMEDVDFNVLWNALGAQEIEEA